MKRSLVAGMLLTIGLACFGPCARGDTVYTYTGYDFRDALAPYTTSDRVAITFSTACPLDVPTLSDVTGLVTGFVFNDGVNTLTNLNSTDSFLINDPAQNCPIREAVYPQTVSVGADITDIHSLYGPGINGDAVDGAFMGTCLQLSGSQCSSVSTVSYGISRDSPRVWGMSTTRVPEPPSMLLLGTELAFTGSIFRKKLRRCKPSTQAL